MKKYLILVLLIISVGIVANNFLGTKDKKITPIENKPVQTKDNDIVEENTAQETPSFARINLNNHVYQTFNNCGPATLSMILSYYGVNKSQKELGDAMRPYQNQQGDNDDKAIFSDEFVMWAEKNGVRALNRVNGDIELLRKFTSNGIPVVVKTWLQKDEDVGHFRIVKGFDDKTGVIIQDDSYQGPNKNITYSNFLEIWQPFNYSYIIVYNQSNKEMVETILGEEIVEKTAWENALKRAESESKTDSVNPYPVFNMATSYYHLGQYDKTVAAYEKVKENLRRSYRRNIY